MLWQTTHSDFASRVGALLISTLSLIGVLSVVGQAVAFDKTCGTLLAPHAAAVQAVPVVVAVRTSGQATGTYRVVKQSLRQWRLGEGDFTLSGRGVVVGQFVVTAAHVVYPSKVELRLDPYITTTTEVVSIQQTLPQDEAREGNVLAPHAVSHQRSVVAGLSANTVSISTPVFPGDSGSPVVAFDAGEPRLVGVITATRQPFEAVSYISRLDPLLPILEALQASTPLDQRMAQVKRCRRV